MSFIVLRGHRCKIIVFNTHAPSGKKSDNSKDSLHEELQQVVNHFPKYHTKILLGDFNAEVGIENISIQQLGLESTSEQ
jgi:hypothetical protein